MKDPVLDTLSSLYVKPKRPLYETDGTGPFLPPHAVAEKSDQRGTISPPQSTFDNLVKSKTRNALSPSTAISNRLSLRLSLSDLIAPENRGNSNSLVHRSPERRQATTRPPRVAVQSVAVSEEKASCEIAVRCWGSEAIEPPSEMP